MRNFKSPNFLNPEEDNAELIFKYVFIVGIIPLIAIAFKLHRMAQTPPIQTSVVAYVDDKGLAVEKQNDAFMDFFTSNYQYDSIAISPLACQYSLYDYDKRLKRVDDTLFTTFNSGYNNWYDCISYIKDDCNFDLVTGNDDISDMVTDARSIEESISQKTDGYISGNYLTDGVLSEQSIISVCSVPYTFGCDTWAVKNKYNEGYHVVCTDTIDYKEKGSLTSVKIPLSNKDYDCYVVAETTDSLESVLTKMRQENFSLGGGYEKTKMKVSFAETNWLSVGSPSKFIAKLGKSEYIYDYNHLISICQFDITSRSYQKNDAADSFKADKSVYFDKDFVVIIKNNKTGNIVMMGYKNK